MNAPEPEFSRIVTVTHISPQGAEEILEAKPAERAMLAKRFDLIDIPSLKAHLSLNPGSNQSFAVNGTIEAEIVQRCVVTLEPLASHIRLDVDTVFIAARKEDMPDHNPDEEVEIFYGGKIDLGEMVAQHLGVNLDPYPRKKGAALPATEFGAKKADIHPFSDLAIKVKKMKNKEKTDP